MELPSFPQAIPVEVNPHDLVRCECADAYTKVFLQNGEVLLVSYHLGAIEQRLPKGPFFRIHKRYLLHVRFLEGVETVEGRQFARMKDGTLLPVATRRSEHFCQALETLFPDARLGTSPDA